MSQCVTRNAQHFASMIRFAFVQNLLRYTDDEMLRQCKHIMFRARVPLCETSIILRIVGTPGNNVQYLHAQIIYCKTTPLKNSKTFPHPLTLSRQTIFVKLLHTLNLSNTFPLYRRQY